MFKFLRRIGGMLGDSKPVYRWNPQLDANVGRVSDGLDYTTLASTMESADTGDIATWVKFTQEMEAKDAHLGAVARTRRLALTGIDWEINPGQTSREEDKPLAKAAAEYVRNCLLDSGSFAKMLTHLAKAIGPNIAVTEIVWDGVKPAEFRNVPGNRLLIDYSRSPEIRITTVEDPVGQVARRGKFIVHTPDYQIPNAFENTVSRSQGKWWLMKNLAIADWATFIEVFGMPTRWATYREGASTTQINVIKNALASMGSLSYGLVPEGTNLEMREAGN